jgi:hypothetical protein
MYSTDLINGALKAAQEGRLRDKRDEELDAMLHECLRYRTLNPNNHLFDANDEALRDEIRRRNDEKKHSEMRQQHEATMQESKNLQSSVQKIGKPHWTLTPSFAVIVLTMIFAAIAAWPVIREWFSTSQPANKSHQFSLPQSNSTPTSITKTQAPPVLQGTNHLWK